MPKESCNLGKSPEIEFQNLCGNPDTRKSKISLLSLLSQRNVWNITFISSVHNNSQFILFKTIKATLLNSFIHLCNFYSERYHLSKRMLATGSVRRCQLPTMLVVRRLITTQLYSKKTKLQIWMLLIFLLLSNLDQDLFPCPKTFSLVLLKQQLFHKLRCVLCNAFFS